MAATACLLLVALLAGCGSQPAAVRTARWRVGSDQVFLRYEAPPLALHGSPLTLRIQPAAVAAVTVVARMTDMSMPAVRLSLKPSAPGVYGGRIVLSMGGPWLYTVSVRLGGRSATKRLRVWANG